LISVGAIIGPFSPLLTFRKSILRALGTTAGLLLSAILIAFLSHLPWSIPILGVLLAYGIAFTSQQNYRYFIMIVTVAIALNFADMYVPVTPFEPLSFFASRAMGVFIGILIYVSLEWLLFGRKEMVRWAQANNSVYEQKLLAILDQLTDIGPSRPSQHQALVSTLVKAQMDHEESLGGLISILDTDTDIDAASRQAKRLQRLGKRLQMSCYRQLTTAKFHPHLTTHWELRRERLRSLLLQPSIGTSIQ